jgi:hypothetical protein
MNESMNDRIDFKYELMERMYGKHGWKVWVESKGGKHGLDIVEHQLDLIMKSNRNRNKNSERLMLLILIVNGMRVN